MKLKRGIALLLAAVFLFGTLAVPASAAAAQPEPAAQAQTVDAEENDIISVRIKASGELTYGADHKLEIQTTPADAQYIGVVMGTSGQATGYVTLVLSEKIRTLLKLIPLPKKMSATPDQTEEFNVYSYLKQLIDGNDVSVLLRVGDEAVSVLNIINFYLPSAYVKTIQNVSNGLKLALDLIRKYLPESAFTRIYLDEQPVDAGGYVAGGKRRHQLGRCGHVQDQAPDQQCAAVLGRGSARLPDGRRAAKRQPQRGAGSRRAGTQRRGREHQLHL